MEEPLRGSSSRILLAALGVIASAGCNTIPGMSTPWVVKSVAPLGPYLETEIANGKETLRFYTPAEAPCTGILRHEQVVEYVSLGPLGQFQSGDEKCDPVGLGSLREWRDRRPRPEVPPLPSRQATYKVEYQDQNVAILRGLFPLTSLIGFPGLGDVLVVIPRNEVCASLLTRETATIEYRVAGPDPLVLYSEKARCPIVGLIQPPPGRA
jgi:hypothetical protein